MAVVFQLHHVLVLSPPTSVLVLAMGLAWDSETIANVIQVEALEVLV